jgi:hypothetical protein
MPTNSQDKEFAMEMKDSVDEVEVKMSHSALDNAINWIGDNLDPDQVFSEEKLRDWAESNGYEKK